MVQKKNLRFETTNNNNIYGMRMNRLGIKINNVCELPITIEKK
jgi:hypothetical protein